MKKLLIVAHTPSKNTENLANAVLAGTKHKGFSNIEARLCSPFDCDSERVLKQDALILFTTENFGYMSGAIKDFFERIYYPCLEQPKKNNATPFSLIIRAGLDGTGTDIAVHKITKGLQWREVQATLLCKGDHSADFIQQCHDHGATMAAGLDNEIF